MLLHICVVSYLRRHRRRIGDKCLPGPHNHTALTVIVNLLTFKHPDLCLGKTGRERGVEGGREGGREGERERKEEGRRKKGKKRREGKEKKKR